ncbi:MAG TPA: hypothetical protein VII56_09395 [Rhizomicrobium sp.]
METTPEDGARVYARTHSKHWTNISAEDVPPGWIDDMVKRLFDELNRQLLRVERASEQISDKKDASGKYPDTSDEREQHARTLKSLQTSLERLTLLDAKRETLRKTVRRMEKPGEIRARLAKKLTAQLERSRAGKIPGEPQ